MIEKKIIEFGRHGDCPQRKEGGSVDELKGESIENMYNQIGLPLNRLVSEQGISIDRTCLLHSELSRTVETGQSIIAGAFALAGDNPPDSREALSRLDFRGIDYVEQEYLIYPKCNLAAAPGDGTYGPNLDFLLQNPNATVHEGQEIDSGNKVRLESLSVLSFVLGRVLIDDYRLAVAVGSSPRVEFPVIQLIETSGKTIKSCEDIGGPFKMEDHAQMIIERNPRSGFYTANLQVRDMRFKVDLYKLRL